MPVGGDDDTLASSLPAAMESTTSVGQAGELVGGRYRVVRWLGGGGMGRVYEALDTELDERVALKVLRGGLSDDALERFRREVKLTRRIQHRNVARMFDIGEHKGEKFLTMELVTGEPLTREISATPMPWPRLKAVAEQICAGLSAAHAAGVIHRDLKPDNVLIERATDRAVLTDFGIARSVEDAGVTQVGAIVGTPRYMSPEQLNSRDIDARADLFSLGVMLFELATGTRPWPGDNAVAIAVSQATVSPRTIDTTTGSVPAYFAAIVAACLQLEPKDRPASAQIVGEAIANGTPLASTPGGLPKGIAVRVDAPTRRTPVPAAPTLVEPTSLAVLPLTCAPADEYLADGLLEDLTDTLSTTPGLRVRPAGVVRGTAAPDPRDLGERLQVDHVVLGSVRRVPTGLRITARLLSVADGFQIWANKTECAEADVLSVAEQLCSGIAGALSTRASSASRPTDPRAVDFYLRARAELRRFWGTHAQSAADLLEQAVNVSPTSPPILGAYAWAAVQAWVMRGEPELLPRAIAAVERGLTGGHGEAFLASAQLNFNQSEPERGATDLARALVRAPMSAQTHELAGKILIEIEGHAKARHHFETARGLDPGRSQVIENELARLDALEGRWEDTDRRLAGILADSDPSIQQLGHVAQARLNGWRGRRGALSEAAKTTMSRIGSNASAIFKLVVAIESNGGFDAALWQQQLDIAIPDGVPTRQYLMKLQIMTEVALILGQSEHAIDAMDRATDLGLMDVTWLDRCPLMEKVVEHKRYMKVRRRVAERAARVLAAFRAV